MGNAINVSVIALIILLIAMSVALGSSLREDTFRAVANPAIMVVVWNVTMIILFVADAPMDTELKFINLDMRSVLFAQIQTV